MVEYGLGANNFAGGGGRGNSVDWAGLIAGNPTITLIAGAGLLLLIWYVFFK